MRLPQLICVMSKIESPSREAFALSSPTDGPLAGFVGLQTYQGISDDGGGMVVAWGSRLANLQDRLKAEGMNVDMGVVANLRDLLSFLVPNGQHGQAQASARVAGLMGRGIW